MEDVLLEIIVQPFLRSLFREPKRLIHSYNSFFDRSLSMTGFVRSSSSDCTHLNDSIDTCHFQPVYLSEIGNDIGLGELDGYAESCDERVEAFAGAITD